MTKNNCFYSFMVLLLTSCFFNQSARQLSRAEGLVLENKYNEAFSVYQKVVSRFPDEDVAIRAAIKAAEISLFNLEKFNEAIHYNRFVVLRSKKLTERLEAQKNIAKIAFENLNDYQASIVEYSKIAESISDPEEKIFARKRIARSYYFLDQFYQAETEVAQLLKQASQRNDIYELKLLKGNIHLAKKEVDSAILIFSGLIREFPEKSKDDNIALHLAICYEEKSDFARAIEILDEMKGAYDTPAFIKDRINNLKTRQALQPGARGLKK